MKLKSKLIATIVSMCAAIAVMGVGVWASTSQNFTVTVKNDVDVKILNVNADVYGEFAIYSQFGKGNKDFAKKYTETQAVKNHGYLLYAIGIGGYNDGLTTEKSDTYDYTLTSDDPYGYQKYLYEAKDYVYLATSNGALKNTRTNDAERSYKDKYNVDSLTHTAQVAYMYTIKQWGKSSASDAPNTIYGKLTDVNLSSESTQNGNKSGLQGGLAGTEKSEAGVGMANAQVRINAYISRSGADWYKLDFTNGETLFTLEETNENTSYYVILTFTFGRNNANLDLSLLDDALRHTFELRAEVDEGDASKYNDRKFSTISTGDTNKVNLAYATTREYTAENSYVIKGSALSVDWANDVKTGEAVTVTPAAVTGAVTQPKLKNLFALTDNDKTYEGDKEVSHLQDGYIYVAAKDDTNNIPSSDWDWLKDLNNGNRTKSYSNGYVS